MHKHNRPIENITKGYNSTTIKATNTPSAAAYDMIVFCHLRWDFVYQRPQHIISRMAETKKILLLEEPIDCTDENINTATLIPISDHLHILKPHVHTIADIATILPQYISNTTASIGWFYSAAFVPLLNELKFEKIVYDCMDELTMFKGASPQLREQERYLMSEADVVFTGGKSLYESKNKDHKNVYCFPSSVDRHHFARALNGIEVADGIPDSNPVIGYYGVIDERIDLDLIRDAAERMPWAHFVMVGPIAKIDHKDLPQAHNIHYPGMASYSMLPNYLKGFDIAMMPFASNDSTKYISPTKTLEYMAAHKPIISTPIYDVVRDYSDCVYIVNNTDEFCKAVSQITNNDEDTKAGRHQRYDSILNNTSWDKTVSKMNDILNNVAA